MNLVFYNAYHGMIKVKFNDKKNEDIHFSCGFIKGFNGTK